MDQKRLLGLFWKLCLWLYTSLIIYHFAVAWHYLSALDLDIINFLKDYYLYFPLSFCRSFVLIPSGFHSPSVNFFHLQNWFKFFVLPSFSSLAHLVKMVLYSASILLMQTLNRMQSFCNKSFVWYLSELLSREFCPCHLIFLFLDCFFFWLMGLIGDVALSNLFFFEKHFFSNVSIWSKLLYFRGKLGWFDPNWLRW